MSRRLPLIALAAALACGDSTGPARPSGIYDLISLDGDALPVTFTVSGQLCSERDVEIVSGSLEFRPAMSEVTFRLERKIRVPNAFPPEISESRETVFTYSVTGGDVIVSSTISGEPVATLHSRPGEALEMTEDILSDCNAHVPDVLHRYERR